jgi:hypothetical protein
MTTQTAKRDRHDEKAIAFFGTWMLIGLYLDGWAHNVEKPETFFSPWHFILYSGFGAAVLYFMFRERVLKKPSSPDRLTIAGLVVFIVGAVGDGIWHEIFGIEVDLEALLSPTHLALMIGGLMMLGVAYRAAVNAVPPEDRASIALIITMALCVALTMFFTQYFSAWRFAGLWTARDEVFEVHALGSVFVPNALLLGFVFLLVRRWKTPTWTFTCAFTVLAAGMVLLDGRSGPMLNVPMAALGGLATDLLVTFLRPRAAPARNARLFSALVPSFVWGFWLVGIQLMDGVHWAAELWTGTLVLAVVQGVGLGLLAFERDQVPSAPALAAVRSELATD